MKLKTLLILPFCFMVGTAIAANVPNPMIMMNSISNKLLSSLRKNRPALKRNPNLIFKLVNKILIPRADLTGMSRAVLGRNAWRGASPAQRTAFTQEFKHIIIKTYASAFHAYTDETIKFYPIRGGYQGRKRVQVYSKIIRKDGPAIPVNYRLALFGNKWKVYDLNVEGVSLLQSFHSQFAAEISQGKTVTQITQRLKQNRRKK